MMKFKKQNEPPINVLIVDDRKENIYVMEELLQDEEINFLSTTSGYEALKIALKHDIALVMLDVQMPEINGYEVAKLLKENNKTRSIPIIFVTALNQEPEYVVEGYETGAVDFLFKPLNPAVTKAKAKAFIQIYLQQKDLEEKNAWLENLGMLVNNSIDVMCILEANKLTIEVINTAWEKVLGYKEEEAIGTSFSSFLSEDLNLSSFLGDAISKNERIVNVELKIRCESGEIRWFSWIFVFKNGRWFVNGRDISKRKEYEEALSRVNEELEERVQERTAELSKINQELKEEVYLRKHVEDNLRNSNEKLVKTNADLDNFVYTASHDLKLPIANMEGLLNTLNDELLNHPSEEALYIVEMLSRSTSQLKETIQDLLSIIKLQKQETTTIEKIDCDKILDEITSSIQDLIEESNARIYKNFEECGKIITFPKASFKSILYNLLTNAIKYSSPDRKPEIHISLKNDGDHFVLSVKDNGLGIKKELQNKLFSMFKRLHDHVEGSGIGLYIVKETVEKYGGKIEVNSQEGEGSEFKIYFKA
ncbi:MAG: ATP-binding protein [Cytophagaceae bacterium]